ncbi:hypothetical protein K8I61_20060 [bacterium]|nr:hypothetical protein [bacterium]
MRDLVPIETVVKDRPSLIVCPATDDGVACSVILNRRLPNIINTLFLPEFSVADIFEYPIFRNRAPNVHLHIAGFSFQEPFRRFFNGHKLEYITWYSHHFWSRDAFDDVIAAGVDLYSDTRLGSSAELVLRKLRIRERVSQEIGRNLTHGRRPESEYWRRWFYASLASRGDLYGIRLVFEALYKRGAKNAEPSEAVVEAGQEVYERLYEQLESASLFRFPIDDGRMFGVVLGIPPSILPYYRTACGIAFELLGASLALIMVDGGEQIVVYRSHLASRELPTRLLGRIIDRVFERPVARLFDRNTLVLTPHPWNLTRAAEMMCLGFGDRRHFAPT